jgi:hypothetical protein
VKRGITLLAILMISVLFIVNPFGLCSNTMAYYVNTQTTNQCSIYAPVQATQSGYLTVTGTGTFSNPGTSFTGLELTNINATLPLPITDIIFTFSSIQSGQGVTSLSIGGVTYALNVPATGATIDVKSTTFNLPIGATIQPMSVEFYKNAKNEVNSITFVMGDGSQKIVAL